MKELARDGYVCSAVQCAEFSINDSTAEALLNLSSSHTDKDGRDVVVESTGHEVRRDSKGYCSLQRRKCSPCGVLKKYSGGAELVLYRTTIRYRGIKQTYYIHITRIVHVWWRWKE